MQYGAGMTEGQVYIVLGVAWREGMVGKSNIKEGILCRNDVGMGVFII